VISEEIYQLHMDDVHPVFVATADTAVQASTASYGGVVIPSIMLVQEVELAYEELQHTMQEYNVYETYLNKLPGDRARWVEDMTLGLQQKLKLASSSNEERERILREEEKNKLGGGGGRLMDDDLQGRLGGALDKDVRNKLEMLKKKLRKNGNKKKQQQQSSDEERSGDDDNKGHHFPSSSLYDAALKIDETMAVAELKNDLHTISVDDGMTSSMSRRLVEEVKDSIKVSCDSIPLINGVYKQSQTDIKNRPHFIKKLPALKSGKLHFYYTETEGLGRWVISEEIEGSYRAMIDSDVKHPRDILTAATTDTDTATTNIGNRWLVFNHTWIPADISLEHMQKHTEAILSTNEKEILGDERKKDPGRRRRFLRSGETGGTAAAASESSRSAFGNAFASILGRNSSDQVEEGKVTVDIRVAIPTARERKSKRGTSRSNQRTATKSSVDNAAAFTKGSKGEKEKKWREPSVKLRDGNIVTLSQAVTYLNEYCLKTWSRPPEYLMSSAFNEGKDGGKQSSGIADEANIDGNHNLSTPPRNKTKASSTYPTFMATVRIPLNQQNISTSSLKKKMSEIKGRRKRSKREARASAALAALKIILT